MNFPKPQVPFFCLFLSPFYFQTEDGASAASENEALFSDTESVGEPEIPKSAAQATPPKIDASEFTEEELKKAEAFKEKGNEFFKGKSKHFD